MRKINWLFACWFVVSSAALFAETYYVSNGGDDSYPGTQTFPFATIQHAADLVNPGDTVHVLAGTYVGARFSRSGNSGHPIVFHGETGAVVSSPGPQNSNNDNLWIRDASYITIEGFESHSAGRAGIAAQGEPSPGELHGLVIRNNDCHDNGRWGIFTAYAEGIRIENNETSYSGAEHGIYVSNSSDNPAITGNIVHHNLSSGIQINADPEMPGDGIISNALIDSNIIYENGQPGGGGAAINLASVTYSTISNNLLTGNHKGGIAGWDDGYSPSYGTHHNWFYNNTVVQAANGRFALSLLNGSSHDVVKNNILYHPGPQGSITVDSSSENGLDSDTNVVTNVFSPDDNTFITLAEWQGRGHDAHSLISDPAELFVDAAGDDYHLDGASPAINTGTVVPVAKDLDGAPRPQGGAYDIGAYEYPLGTTVLFADDFEDGVIGDWQVTKPAWVEEGGKMNGDTSRKAEIHAVFGGCSICTIDTTVSITDAGSRAWVLGWYVDRGNMVELILMGDKSRWLLKQRSGSRVLARAKSSQVFALNTDYHAILSFDGTTFHVIVDGIEIITLRAAASPFGGVGYRVKSATRLPVTAAYSEITVN